MKKFVAIGHVDTGKSTLCGHILYKCGYIDERNMEKIRTKAKLDGMEDWIYARILDIYDEEAIKGKTHEFDSILFEYNKKQYQMIDTPGHQKFIRSMIEGISQDVNIATLLISMKDNEFDSSFGGGSMKEHMLLARAIGIEYMVLITNKMDLIEWDEKKCKEKTMIITKYLVKELGWPKENLFVVPISAMDGTGLVDTVGLPDWYKGKSFLETLDSLPDRQKDSYGELIESNRFVCDITNFDTIMTSSYKCIFHFNGLESESVLEKIQAKQFLRAGDKGKCIFNFPNKEFIAVGMRVILRKGENTVGFGKITTIK